MKTLNQILIASAVGVLAACTSDSPYVYDTYYAYYPVAYDDAYYDAAMVGGYYYYPTYYYYAHKTKAAASLDVIPPAVRILLRRWNASVDPGCITATYVADNDRDGIDANSTVTFQCDADRNGGTAQVNGAVTVTDLDDTASDAGYRLVFNGLSVRVVSATGALTERLLNGTEQIEKSDGGGTLVTRDVTTNATDTFPDNVERKSKLEMKAQSTFMPEPVPGSALITRGTLTLSGQGIFTAPDGAVFTLTRQTDPTLHWNNDCARETNGQGFDSGAIVYRSSQGRQTRIAYESCTAVTVTNTTVPAPAQ